MIDIHTHILPGLDDGSTSLDQSVRMIGIAAETGTSDLVATPHANLQFRFDPALVEQRIAEVQAAAGNAVRIHQGCDFHLYFDNIQDALANPAKYTINHKNYLLVEFPDLLIAKASDEIFARLRGAGIIPVITHPERNYLLQRRIDQLREWAEAGVLLQVTAQSFLGRFGVEARDFARELMKAGLVHVVASDAHDAEDRTPRLDEAYQHVARRFGEWRAERLFVTNPRAILAGEPLPEEPQAEPVSPRPWYRFWG